MLDICARQDYPETNSISRTVHAHTTRTIQHPWMLSAEHIVYLGWVTAVLSIHKIGKNSYRWQQAQDQAIDWHREAVG